MSVAGLTRKVLENRKRQHAIVIAHKRKIRDEINPYLREKRREWYESSRQNRLSIKAKWIAARSNARAQLRAQQLKHKEVIRAHRSRIMLEVAKRR